MANWYDEVSAADIPGLIGRAGFWDLYASAQAALGNDNNNGSMFDPVQTFARISQLLGGSRDAWVHLMASAESATPLETYPITTLFTLAGAKLLLGHGDAQSGQASTLVTGSIPATELIRINRNSIVIGGLLTNTGPAPVLPLGGAGFSLQGRKSIVIGTNTMSCTGHGSVYCGNGMDGAMALMGNDQGNTGCGGVITADPAAGGVPNSFGIFGRRFSNNSGVAQLLYDSLTTGESGAGDTSGVGIDLDFIQVFGNQHTVAAYVNRGGVQVRAKLVYFEGMGGLGLPVVLMDQSTGRHGLANELNHCRFHITNPPIAPARGWVDLNHQRMFESKGCVFYGDPTVAMPWYFVDTDNTGCKIEIPPMVSAPGGLPTIDKQVVNNAPLGANEIIVWDPVTSRRVNVG